MKKPKPLTDHQRTLLRLLWSHLTEAQRGKSCVSTSYRRLVQALNGETQISQVRHLLTTLEANGYIAVCNVPIRSTVITVLVPCL
jgi:hypothetical protein